MRRMHLIAAAAFAAALAPAAAGAQDAARLCGVTQHPLTEVWPRL